MRFSIRSLFRSFPLLGIGLLPLAVAADTGSVSFVRDVLPVLSKAGCNSGGCHAKAEGQNGFKLSVFASDPRADYEAITRGARGRRVFPGAPEASLLLLKPSMGAPHGGGRRLSPDSEMYRIVRDWIAQGLPWTTPGEATLTNIAVFPPQGSYAKNATNQLRVTAQYANGTSRDVTHLAQFQSTEKEIVQTSESGSLTIGGVEGEAVVVARYMGYTGISKVTVPTAAKIDPELYRRLPANNEIDRLVYAQLEKLGLEPSGECTDAEFLRRASLDAIGVLPTVEQTRRFLGDTGPDKRARLIDELLGHPLYAHHWATKWGDWIRPNTLRVGIKGVYVFDQWLREAFRQNMPYHEMVREILNVKGRTDEYGPAVVFRDRREPQEAATFVSQIFLGVRMECAKCHHHPNEKWRQQDFYELAACFGKVKRKGRGYAPPINAGAEFVFFTPTANVKHPVTGERMKPRPLDGPALPDEESEDPRAAFLNWMTSPGNQFFARSLVNRVWAEFLGRGIVHPVDDFRASNPPTNEPLLDWLAADFVRGGYDLKGLMRRIMSSRVYQLSSTPAASNAGDTKNFARSYRRRLPAETLLDAVCDFTGVPEKFEGLPPGSRAVENWSYHADSFFMDAFGRPNSSSDCPCERDSRGSVAQSLHLMNSTQLHAKLADPNGRARVLAESKLSPAEIVGELYAAAFCRQPDPEEREIALAAFAAPGATRKSAVEDLMWALLNTAEFVFNH